LEGSDREEKYRSITRKRKQLIGGQLAEGFHASPRIFRAFSPRIRSASSELKKPLSTQSLILAMPISILLPAIGQSVPKSTLSLPIRLTASPMASAGCQEVSTRRLGNSSARSKAIPG